MPTPPPRLTCFTQKFMEVKETIWKKCLEKIEESILPDSYATWFSHTYPRNLEDGLITIAVPNQFYRKCLIENYRELIENSLKAVANESILVDFCIESEKNAQKEQSRGQPVLVEEVSHGESKLNLDLYHDIHLPSFFHCTWKWLYLWNYENSK